MSIFETIRIDVGLTVIKKLNIQMDKLLKVEPGVNAVQFVVFYEEADEPTAQQLLEAVSEALIMHWDNAPIEDINEQDYDA